jgi:hypothetical protein
VTAPTTTATGPTTGANGQTYCGTRHAANFACVSASAPTAANTPPSFRTLGPAGAVPRVLWSWLLEGSPMTLLLRWLGVCALVLLALPSVVRLRRRHSRTRSGRPRRGRGGERVPEQPSYGGGGTAAGPRRQALAAWEELRDDATDLGYAWPSTATPRQVRDGLVTAAALHDDARDAIGRVTTVAERAHYAPTIDDLPPNLFHDVRTVRAGLAAHASHLARLRANVLPTSVLVRPHRKR